MTWPVATVELVHRAPFLAETVHSYVWEFGKLALLDFRPVKYPLDLLPLLEHQSHDGLLALLPVVRVASARNYAYSVRLEELIPKRLVTGKSDCHAF